MNPSHANPPSLEARIRDTAARITGGASPSARTPLVVVVWNRKGGSGKSTTSLSLALAYRLGLSGAAQKVAEQRVAVIDLDMDLNTSAEWADARAARKLKSPDFLPFRDSELMNRDFSLEVDSQRLISHIAAFKQTHDVVIVDCAGTSAPLHKIALLQADVVISPMNETAVDLAALGRIEIDQKNRMRPQLSPFVHMMFDVRTRLARAGRRSPPWIWVRGRRSGSTTAEFEAHLDAFAQRYEARVVLGAKERAAYWAFYARGLHFIELPAKTVKTVDAAFDRAEALKEVAALRAAIEEETHGLQRSPA